MIELVLLEKEIKKNIKFINTIDEIKSIVFEMKNINIKKKYIKNINAYCQSINGILTYEVEMTFSSDEIFNSNIFNDGKNMSFSSYKEYDELYIKILKIKIHLKSRKKINFEEIDFLLSKISFDLDAEYFDEKVDGDLSRYSYKIRAVNNGVLSNFVNVENDSVIIVS